MSGRRKSQIPRVFGFLAVLAVWGVTVRAQSSITYVDDFEDNPNNWWTGSDANATASISNGTYTLERRSDRGFWGLWPGHLPPIGPDENFQLDLAVRFIKGGTSGYGLFWGGVGIEKFHYFNIASTGSYLHQSFADNTFIPVIDWTTSTAIRKGQATNELRVCRLGPTLLFSVNGTLVNKAPFKAAYGPTLGLMINRAMTLAVDDIVVTRWSKAVPGDLNVIIDGAFDSRVTWPNAAGWAPFDCELTPGGSVTVNATGGDGQMFANATFERPVETPVGSSIGTYIGTSDGALVKLEWVHARAGYVVRLSAFCGSEAVGTREIPWGESRAALVLRRHGASFRAEVMLEENHKTVRRAEVGKLEWPGLADFQNAGVAGAYGTGKGPAKVVYRCLDLYVGGGKG